MPAENHFATGGLAPPESQLQLASAEPPAAVESCLHHLIDRRCEDRPDAPAVCAWNGDFTYGQLGTLARLFGALLAAGGVGPEVFVPIYFEKSRWTIVAILGVLQAGGAFWMCRTVNAHLVVASSHNATKASSLAPRVVVLDDKQQPDYTKVSPETASRVKSNNAAYVIFTSGSTGTPKGAVIEHRSISSSSVAHGPRVNITSASRALQFASYAFDACLLESLTVLVHGGCVCIPSETERRSDLTGAIARLRVNWASITPSMAHSMEPETLPSLETLVLIGEAMSKEDIKQWASHVQLFNGYGPTECTILACTHAMSEAEDLPIKIGHAVGGSCWIVDENDIERVRAVGQAGELLIEGPIVGRGYIGDPSKTAAAFVDRPEWLRKIWPDAHGKVYKTGDLARCFPDGTIECLGRKDSQLKVHGQRMEAAEIEYHLRRHLGNMDVAVEVVKPRDDAESPILAAFVVQEPKALGDTQKSNLEAHLTMQNEDFGVLAHTVKGKLRQALPSYMVPTAVLTLSRMPLSTSGKLDRRSLRELGGSRSRRELQKLSFAATIKAPPRDRMEESIQGLWAEVLHLPVESIGVEDSFWSLGGSSIRAMKLAGVARQRGLKLMVEDIWGAGTLEEMAANASTKDVSAKEVPVFALCENQNERMELMNTLSEYGIKQDDIEDIYPCTRLQEGLFSLTAKSFGAYTMSMEFELPGNINIDRFRRAWETTVEANPILRTRIVPGNAATLWQAVIRDIIPWDSRDPADEIPTHWKNWHLGQRLIRLALSNSTNSGAPHLFTLVIHHALTDGWGLPLVLQQVEAAYKGQSLTSRPFSPFVQYLTRGDQADLDRHWKENLVNLNAAIFPKLPSPGYTPKPTTTTTCTIPMQSGTDMGYITLAARLKLAWGILLSHYTDSWDVLFGVTVAGRGAPVEGIESMTGPTIATIPLRLLLEPQATVIETLEKIHTHSLQTMSVEQAGLQRISRLGAEPAAACQFQSLLVIQPDESDNERPPMFAKCCEITQQAENCSHGVTVVAKPSSTSVELSITYDPLMITDVQMTRLTHQFEHIHHQIQRAPTVRLQEIGSVSASDMAELRKWNGRAPRQVEECAHELIYQRTLIQPEASAVCAWDGGFSYQELEDHASNLARHLSARGVGAEVFVPLYFEKSRWTTVAMLAVLKAGGAFVLLDASHPLDRLQNICRDTRGSLVICSEAKASFASELGLSEIVILGPNQVQFLERGPAMEPCNVMPSNAMYVVFTSGSTGKPKGAVITHGGWCTIVQANYPKAGLGQGSRVLQFAAYAFDMSVWDNLVTLVAGGCVCVPSDQDRLSNLTGAIAALRANWATITPSIARILSPQTSPTLKHLALGGEPMTAADVQKWSPYLHLMNSYGPAECAMQVSLKENLLDPSQSTNIGTFHGAVGWVVDPQNAGRLRPIGAVGELLIEGPSIAREYLDNPQRTAEAFLENPPWMHEFRDEACRLYKTGDLVQYTADGELVIVGRKDTQVKLRGQRVEMGEVEYHLRRSFPDAQGVVTDLLYPHDGRAALLAGFVLRTPILGHTNLIADSDANFRKEAGLALSAMSQALPPYMVPAVLIPLNRLPLSPTGKVNRRELCSQAALLSREQLEQLIMEGKTDIRDPETHTQCELRRLYADVLSIPEDKIGIEDDFFRRGGDSLSAIKLVAGAQKLGYAFTVADVFTRPRIVDLVAGMSIVNGAPSDDIVPLSLVPSLEVQEQVVSSLLAQSDLTRDQIEDVYPTTPMQEGLMALSLKSPGKYVATFVYDLEEGINLNQLREAVNSTVSANPILRTRLTQTPEGTFQVVIREAARWMIHATQQECDEARAQIPVMGPNKQLLRLDLITDRPQLVVTIHHALYDGWSLPLLWDQIEAAYRGHALQPRPFSPFIRFLQRESDATSFWQSQFEGLDAGVFPPLPSSTYQPKPSHAIHRLLPMPPYIHTDVMMTTAIQLAWAVIMSYYTDSNDVVFGLTLSGRNAPVVGIDEFTGPTLTAVPFRTKLHLDRPIQQVLREIKNRLTAMMPYEQTGLRDIRSVSEDAVKASEFQSQLGIQPPGLSRSGTLATEVEGNAEGYGDFTSYGIVMVCHLAAEKEQPLDVIAQYDPNMLDPSQANRIVVQFEHVLVQILSCPDMRIGDISPVSGEDWRQLERWNAKLPPSSEQCLHDLVLDHSLSRPDTPAISAWDGELTFRELGSLSQEFALALRSKGLQQGTIVPLCMTRSRWCILSMMAVLRSGATLVCMDPTLPAERLQNILDQTQPQIVIASHDTKYKFDGSPVTVVTFPSADQSAIPDLASDPEPVIDPSTPAFIVFTSGSTGQPKGIVMEHRNLSTSIQAHSASLGVSRDSRVLHFASYAFDASIYEVFTTLATGGCLCIPSESDRMNAIEEFIKDKQVDVAILAPSVLATLDPDQVPSVRTVTVGGEALTRHVAGHWASRVTLINGYGPAETTICAAGRVEASWKPGTIGPMLGGVAWVTVPTDPQRLAPLGAIGELIIEGPVVTRGYLNRPDLTREGYIDAPEWLVRWRNGKPGRVYRSGDLVELNTEGAIRFVGRKDTQVKLRGQRIELAEVEYHVNRWTASEDVIVDIAAVDGSSILFACMVDRLSEQKSVATGLLLPPTQGFLNTVQAAEAAVRGSVPAYMVPAVFLPVANIPRTAGGKVDRRCLRDAVAGLSPADLQMYKAGSRHEHRPPSNAREEAIRCVLARVLNKDPDVIGMDDSFFHLGGDSITAMRMISQLRRVGITTTVEDIFKQGTIGKLAPTVSDNSNAPSHSSGDATLNMSFRLSPIQQLFFDRTRTQVNHFDHGFMFELQKTVSSDQVNEAVRWIVKIHGMLRARFSSDDTGTWHQTITTDVDTSYRYRTHQKTSCAEAEVIFKNSQETLQIQHGPLIAVDLINMNGGKQWLSLIAHRLVADMRSSQVIMHQLEQLLTSLPVSPPPSIQYPTWCQFLDQYTAANPEVMGQEAPEAQMDYWELTNAGNVNADADEYGIFFNEEDTMRLLGQANESFQTRPGEIIHAALIFAFAKSFPDRSTPVFFVQDHDRDPWAEDLDVTGTVGVLDSIYPCDVQVDSNHSLTDVVRCTKDTRRDVQLNGRFFLSAQHHQIINMEVVFNYRDNHPHMEKPGSLFGRAHMPSSALLNKGPKLVRFAPIEILAEVVNAQLRVHFKYSRSMKKAPAILGWADQSLAVLSSLARQLPTLTRQITRSDLPLLHLKDEQFERFRTQTIDPLARTGHVVVDAYPCSPIQHGMLVSQAKKANDYVNRAVFTVQSRQGEPVDVNRLADAWQKVVQKHPILRTIFVDSPRGDGTVDQVVLDSVQLDVISHVSAKTDDPLQELCHHQSAPFPVLCPPHRLTVCQSATGTVACCWEVHHALVDGISSAVVFRDLLQAYDGFWSPDSDRVYRDYMAHLQRQSPTPCQQYWDEYTENLHPCFFPKLDIDDEHGLDTHPAHFTRSLAGAPALHAFCQLHELTMATVFQIAWGLVLRAYTKSDDVCYGYMTSGRDTPIQGIEDAVGPFINLLVRRVNFHESQSAIATLRQSQEDFTQCLPYQYWPLAAITHRHGSLLFNSVMSVHSGMPHHLVPDSSLIFHEQGGHNATEYDLALHIETGKDHVDVVLDYSQMLLTESQASFVLDAFEQAVQGLITQSKEPVKSVCLLGGDSRKAVWEWNREYPNPVERCVGDMILDHSRIKPETPAVCAWDGNFTYAELAAHSANLSNRLQTLHGVVPETFVPIYAVKSRWVAVAITAVIRSGGAFILLDPSHPLERLRTICTNSRATLVLSRPQEKEIAAKLMDRVVTYGEEKPDTEGTKEVDGCRANAVQLTPDNTLYGIFTSGSTGQPKGVIIQHRAFATSAVTQAGTLRIGPQSRVLQFASFAFDVAVGEILTTLIQGGCLCIPSEEQRQQALPRAAYELQANWAFFTPSVARVLRPTDFPTLRCLVLAGEAVGNKEIQMWSPRLHLILGYGPSECAVWCSGTVDKCHPETDERSLGRWFGCRIWIVDQDDPDVLVPLGAAGELVIDGPIIGRGYLNDPVTTNAAFLDGPRAWGETQSGRIYRTGDLARYKADGTLQFVARKDLQVKLRGQRFELADVEHNLRQVFDDTHDTFAEVTTTSNNTKLLVAFVYASSASHSAESDKEGLLGAPTREFRTATEAAEAQLRTKMPGYMVPTLFLPLQGVPLTNNGKLDRRQLRNAVTSLSLDDVQAYSAPVTARTQPSTPAERQLQKIWSEVLVRPAETIGVEDNFFRLGGDSLRAMTLIPGAREAGYTITMADVFNNPRLSDLAKIARQVAGETTAPLEPFALIADSTDLIDIAAQRCGASPGQIEDIYPCTPLQEGLMALSTKSADRYKVTFRYQLDSQVNLEQFQSAWIAIAALNPILRTRMIQSDYHPGTFQVVLVESPHFYQFDNPGAYEEHIQDCEMVLGRQLADFSLIKSAYTGRVQFCLTLHHSLYDGWTIPSLWDQVHTYYSVSHMPQLPCPFNRFIDYVQRQSESAAEYWRSEFSELSASIWPALPSARHTPMANASLHHTITGLQLDGGSGYTATTLIQLAWAMVMSCQTDSDDVVYGVTLNGRSAPLVGIEEMAGPTIASFPLRVRLGLDSDTVEDALSAIQQQGAKRIPYQQFGLQNIRNLSSEAGQACQFQSQLGIQPASTASQKAGGLVEELHSEHGDYAAFAEYAFVIICHLDDTDTSSIQVVVNYDPQVVSSMTASRILGQFSHLLQELPRNLETPLNQIDALSPDDRHQLSSWNRKLPSPLSACLHDLVISRAIAAPGAPAISAWDGNLTYEQLIAVSGQLAGQLRLFGVQRGSLVPVCFEKSKWAAITMLAVLRAGGACVPLDPGHPADHIEKIIRRANAKVVLTSPETRLRIPADCGATVTAIPLQGLAAHATAEPWPQPSPNDASFVIFTSGSTGEPKGILMEHVNLCTSIRDHSPPMLISPSTRALHFASYAFDASIYELFSMLCNGACVCIPSDSDRLSNLAAFIRDAKVNYAIFTPSILNRLLRPELVPSLRTVTFGGEAVTQDVVDTWAPHVTLINGYGPAEATICAAGPIDVGSWTAGTIGPVTGGLGWVTMPSDVSRLAPVGAVGELVIEGPVVTRGYLNDAERTADAYISPPGWLSQIRGDNQAGRLYRTGDLVQYTDDGGIRFVGRKDTQIKLRGQRVELSHVEHQVRLCFLQAAEIVAEVVMRKGNPTLVAFIAQMAPDDEEPDGSEGANDGKNKLFLKPSTSFRAQVQSAVTRLKTLLPVYLVPGLFLHLARVPRTSSDKLDRRRLRDQAASLSSEQIQDLSTQSGSSSAMSHPPQTARERLFQQLWGAVLDIPVDSIGARDDFFELGGDSIMAMKLTSHLRQQGLTLNVSDIFAWPVLAEQASGAKECTDQAYVESYHPGSLLGIDDLQSFAIRELDCSFPGLEIEDILPTTDFQRGFLEHQEIYYLQLHLPMEINVARLEQACHAIIERHPMLRSVFVPHDHSYLQIQFRRIHFRLTQFPCDDDLASVVERLSVENAARGVAKGVPYFQASLISRSQSESVLLLRASHAQFDGESMPLIVQDLISVYEGTALEKAPPSFGLYLRHRQSHANPQTFKFWQQYLQGAALTSLPLSGSDSDEKFTFRQYIPLPTPPRGITLSSLVKAAWAVVLAQVTGQRDVVVSHVLNGRDTPVAGVHAISGPCVTVSPIRITIPSSDHVLDLLRHVQAQYTRSLPYAGIDFQAIRQHSTSWPANTAFSHFLTHQNGASSLSFKIQGHDCTFNSRVMGGKPAFHVVTLPLQDQLIVHLSISGRLGSMEDMKNLSNRYCAAITDLGRGVFPSLSE
ncbi:nonribosomal peptide synthetase [Aspergillus steynii IBT 23096]|uniref:Nonribosomal peptide synthetase n=1 Tax=Aspergillus steynii IBT 23096 TaxID=1392250 RepID=A0A2I2GF24_9EURO|nr:nonribosomal peptide synthetase [Aspergillus steynii IBT 23096]PLB51476.1 nonribosomal peptide synthetase [Aspergillus steynii IBT 23096]